MYIYQQKGWPNFNWNHAKIADLLADVRHLQGRLLGRMDAIGFTLKEEATLQTLTQDVMKTSEIEGENLNYDQVRSSLAKRLGINIISPVNIDRNVEGIVEILLDATRNYGAQITKNRLFDWHAALFPTGRSGMIRITVGDWRKESGGPMQVISGPLGREKIHYEAPSHDKLAEEMNFFIKWCNAPAEIDPVLKASIAHFWFVTIHPFDDGNGRIARAMADLMLARSERSTQRFYSMSMQIQKERKHYYNVLEQCQKGGLDITIWIEWFLTCLKHAIEASEETLKFVLMKARFWEEHRDAIFNNRQKTIINCLLDGFEEKLTSSKWAKICKCSQDTALRDITDLITRQVLIKEDAGGRSTSYILKSNNYYLGS